MEEMIKIALQNLFHHRSRTALTLLGVVIGIASVVSLISLGDGLNRSIGDQLEQLGPNTITVIPRGVAGFGPSGGATSLSEKDLTIIKRINDVDSAIPILSRSLPARLDDESVITTVTGFPSKDAESFFSDIQSFELAEGRFMKEGEKSVIVIGSRVAEDMFEKNVRLNSNIKISGQKFQVIGILKPIGNQQDDRSILMSIESMRDLTGEKDEITIIMVKAREDPAATATKIENELEDFHNEKLFTAFTSEQILEQINSVFGIISIVLTGIAGISLLVASFGIINTMLMSVLERTREIGIMKAIGATNRKILTMFLTESAMIGFIGGLLGVIVGYSMAFGIAGAGINFLGIALIIVIDPILVVSVLVFATGVGIAAGTYPAYRAAKLDPIVALRYE